ncbi:hypothetical protein FJY90_03615 [Candidatus Gottesmanbacteria bacterium]|nr:hypothetical protein [Candidatus Gottesmanbacteria bacterium]
MVEVSGIPKEHPPLLPPNIIDGGLARAVKLCAKGNPYLTESKKLTARGKQAAARIYRNLVNACETKEQLDHLGTVILSARDDRLRKNFEPTRQAVAEKLVEERGADHFKAKGSLQAAVTRAIKKDPVLLQKAQQEAQDAKLARRLLNSVQQRYIQRKRGVETRDIVAETHRKQIKKAVTNEDLEALRREFRETGRRIPPDALLENVIVVRRLQEEKFLAEERKATERAQVLTREAKARTEGAQLSIRQRLKLLKHQVENTFVTLANTIKTHPRATAFAFGGIASSLLGLIMARAISRNDSNLLSQLMAEAQMARAAAMGRLYQPSFVETATDRLDIPSQPILELGDVDFTKAAADWAAAGKKNPAQSQQLANAQASATQQAKADRQEQLEEQRILQEMLEQSKRQSIAQQAAAAQSGQSKVTTETAHSTATESKAALKVVAQPPASPLIEKVRFVLKEQGDIGQALQVLTEKYPGIEGARKLIIPTTEQLKQWAREGKLFYSNNHPVVIIEAEYLKYWASQPPETRTQLLDVYADAFIDGLEKVYDGNKPLIVALEAGHMSVAPPGQRTQDTGTAATTTEGQYIAEKQVNVQLTKIIAARILQRHPNWVPVVNSDENGYNVSQVATFAGNEFDVRCLDAVMLTRVVWEALADNGEMVRLSIHFNGAEGNPRGGVVIPQAAGDNKPQSDRLAAEIVSALKAKVSQLIGGYSAQVMALDSAIDPYPITDAASDNRTSVLAGDLNSVRSKANRYVTRLIAATQQGLKALTEKIGPTDNS